MILGLKKGTVALCDHQPEWAHEAEVTISKLREILGSDAVKMEHIGSTSINSIKAKPIIDIAVATDSFEKILSHEKELRNSGFYYRPEASGNLTSQLLFAYGSFYDGTGELQTHFIHVVLSDSMEWRNYINFRNYLIKNRSVAKEYEKLKLSLAEAAPIDSGREKYLNGKHDFITYTLRKAMVDSFLGEIVDIEIDRPVGYTHKKKNYTLTYPINYGYIPGVLGGDGEELDVYLMGEGKPVEKYRCRIIGIVHRKNDVEDKLIAAPIGSVYKKDEIAAAIEFQEKYYQTEIEALYK